MAQPPALEVCGAEDDDEQGLLYSGSLSESSSAAEEESDDEEASSDVDTEEAALDAEALAGAQAVAAGLCGVCRQQPHKYCCPGCGCRTCSLPCSKQHKAATSCSGQRDRLGYVPLQGFDDKQLLSGARVWLCGCVCGCVCVRVCVCV